MKYLVLFSGLAILIGLFAYGVISYKFPTYPQMQTYEDVIEYASTHHMALPDTQALKDSAFAYYRKSMDGETRMLSLHWYRLKKHEEDSSYNYTHTLNANDFTISECHVDEKNQIVYYFVKLKKWDYYYSKIPDYYCGNVAFSPVIIAYHYPTSTLSCFHEMDWDIPEHRYNFRNFMDKTGITYTSYREYVKILDKCYSNNYSYCHNFLGMQDLVRSYWKTTYYDSLYNDDTILARGKNIHYSAFRAVHNIYILSFHDSILNHYQVLPISRIYPHGCSCNDKKYDKCADIRLKERKHKYP